MKKNLPADHISLIKVKSSNIRSIGYRESDETLKVKFQNGTVYLYTPVTKEQHEKLMSAPSVGKEFNASIKKDTTIKVEKLD